MKKLLIFILFLSEIFALHAGKREREKKARRLAQAQSSQLTDSTTALDQLSLADKACIEVAPSREPYVATLFLTSDSDFASQPDLPNPDPDCILTQMGIMAFSLLKKEMSGFDKQDRDKYLTPEHISLISTLKQLRPLENTDGSISLLLCYATPHYLKILEALLNAGAHPDCCEGKPLKNAIDSHDIAAVTLLLNKGANPNVPRYQHRGGHVSSLLERMIDDLIVPLCCPSRDDDFPVFESFLTKVTIVNLLITRGACLPRYDWEHDHYFIDSRPACLKSILKSAKAQACHGFRLASKSDAIAFTRRLCNYLSHGEGKSHPHASIILDAYNTPDAIVKK